MNRSCEVGGNQAGDDDDLVKEITNNQRNAELGFDIGPLDWVRPKIPPEPI